MINGRLLFFSLQLCALYMKNSPHEKLPVMGRCLWGGR